MVILEGEVTTTIAGETKTLKQGDGSSSTAASSTR